MRIDSIELRGYSCFKSDWTGFEQIKSINIIIGRNNTGKSQLINIVETLCRKETYLKGVEYKCSGILDEHSLRGKFPEGTSQGELRGEHWNDHGRRLVGNTLMWEVNPAGNVTILNSDKFTSPYGDFSTQARLRQLKSLATDAQYHLTGKTFLRLCADRNIHQEPESKKLILAPDGSGATNIVRRYITSSSLPRETIQQQLRGALTEIFAGDGKFTELQVQQYDEEDTDLKGLWEIYLGEENKGLISLSQSGSGLKTVILVLLNLLVIPEIEKKSKESYVFAFEELENNLHPALLRRLLLYLENYAKNNKSMIFLTTHSSVALDFFGFSDDAQIIHVTHDGNSAKSRSVSAYFDHLGIISELGAKPSDLLQANGIIWVEGPSDCVYIKKWIDVFSDSSLQEGRDYQCAFYGGSLLARTQFASPEEEGTELINLFRINSNIIVVCDGDQSGPKVGHKDRVSRIKSEVDKIPNSLIWITSAREIENYLPGSIISSALDLQALPDPEKYEPFFPKKDAAKKMSFIEGKIQRKGIDKMDLALRSTPYITKETMETRFDLAVKMSEIIKKIRSWNV